VTSLNAPPIAVPIFTGVGVVPPGAAVIAIGTDAVAVL